MATTELSLNADGAGFESELNDLAGAVDSLQRSIRRINGDPIEDAGDDAEKAAKQMERAKDESTGLFNSLVKGSVVITGVNQAFALLGRGVDFARDSVERYLRQNEEGDKMWEQLERRLFAIRGMFAELVLGTDDTEEGFGQLIEAADLVVGVFRELIGMVSIQKGAFVDFVRNGLAFLIDGIATGIRIYQAFRNAIDLVSFGMDAAVTSIASLDEAFWFIVGTISETVLGAFADILGALENVTRGIANFGGRFNPLRNQLNAGADAIDGFRFTIEEMAGSAERTSDEAFSGLMANVAGFEQRAEQAAQETSAFNAEIDQMVGDFRNLADSVRDGTFEFEAMDIELDGGGGGGGLVQSMTDLRDVMQDIIGLGGSSGSLFGLLADGIQYMADAMTRAKEASRELSNELAKGQQAAFDQQQIDAAREAQEQADRIDLMAERLAPVQDAFTTFFGKIEGGQVGLLQAIRETIAEEAWAKGLEALITSPLLLFTRGPQAVAYQAGAGAAAMGAAALIRSGSSSGGGGAVGAGLAPPPASGSASVQTFSTDNSRVMNIHGNVVGDPRRLAELADDMDRAQQQYGAI